jgi:phage shock protein E
MLQLFKKLLGKNPEVNYNELISDGAIIVDVRTAGEYKNAHIKNSINIPLENLENNLSKLEKDKNIICCCASGMRSAAARNILKSKGFNKVYNGGGWKSLQSKFN